MHAARPAQADAHGPFEVSFELHHQGFGQCAQAPACSMLYEEESLPVQPEGNSNSCEIASVHALVKCWDGRNLSIGGRRGSLLSAAVVPVLDVRDQVQRNSPQDRAR